MSRHLDKKTKYHYVMRYLNGESPTKLGKEINPLAKSPEGIVIVWSKKYYLEGIKGLKSKSGTKKGKGR